jgi:hypothetical protein
MSEVKWGETVEAADRRDQLRLVYDYIKFHIGLYLGTPAALSIIADALGVQAVRILHCGAACGYRHLHRCGNQRRSVHVSPNQ